LSNYLIFQKEDNIFLFNKIIIFTAIFISLLAFSLLATGCCQLGAGVTSFLEDVKEQKEVELTNQDDSLPDEEEEETTSSKEEENTSMPAG